MLISTELNLIIPLFGPADVGGYTFSSINAAGVAKTRPGRLSLAPARPLRITEAPVDRKYTDCNFILRVRADGTGPIQYQWFKENVPLDGATSAVLRIFDAGADDSGEYTVTVSNTTTRLTTKPMRATYVSTRSPFVASQPRLLSARAGQYVTLSPDLGFDDNCDLHWTKDGSVIPNETNSTLTFSPLSQSHVGDYRLTAVSRKIEDGSVSTALIRVEIATQPDLVITHHPGDLVLPYDRRGDLKILLAPGVNTQRIYWLRNGVELPNSHALEFRLSTGAPEASGTYQAVVATDRGEFKSQFCHVSVRSLEPPVPFELPSLTRSVDGMAYFYVPTEDRLGIVRMQWRKDGVELPGRTLNFLSLEDLRAEDSGRYSVVCTTIAGVAESTGGVLQVVPAIRPVTVAQPNSENPGPGGRVSLMVSVLSEIPITYQWMRNGEPISGAIESSYLTPGGADTDTDYTVLVSNAGGSIESQSARISFEPPDSVNVIVRQPASQAVALGSSFNLNVQTTLPSPRYQWRRNGVNISGANGPLLTLGRVTVQDAGIYSVAIASDQGSVVSEEAVVRVDPSGRLLNLSSRAVAITGSGALIAGFSVTGPVPKRMLIRGIGPAFSAFGVQNPLPDPKLALFSAAGALLAEVDNVPVNPMQAEIAAETARVGGFPLAASARDAPMLVTLDPGGYTVHLTNVGPAAEGVALIEVYDCSANASRLVNVSTRTRVASGEEVLISGITVDAGAPKKLLIRAAGPALSEFGVDGVVEDPELRIVSMTEDKVVAANDDWEAGGAAALEIAAMRTGAFAFKRGSRDAALLITLPPGGYSAIVSGRNGASGVALVEVYEVIE